MFPIYVYLLCPIQTFPYYVKKNVNNMSKLCLLEIKKTKWNILGGRKHLIFIFLFLGTKIKIRYIFEDRKLI